MLQVGKKYNTSEPGLTAKVLGYDKEATYPFIVRYSDPIIGLDYVTADGFYLNTKEESALNLIVPELAANLLKVVKCHPHAKLPEYSSDGAACFDMYATESALLPQGQSCTLNLGLKFEIPKDHVMLIFSRSGMGFKDDIRLANCVGVIDSDYRGEVAVKLRKDAGGVSNKIDIGDRIAQGMIIPVERFTIMEVEQLEKTERGANGFGSTGK